MYIHTHIYIYIYIYIHRYSYTFMYIPYIYNPPSAPSSALGTTQRRAELPDLVERPEATHLGCIPPRKTIGKP